MPHQEVSALEKITTTIRREHLREIAAGRKRTEYREMKPYWEHRFSSIGRPFLLRLRNGMVLDAPEVTILIDQVRRNRANKMFELRISEVLEVLNWDIRREEPLPRK